MTNKTVRYSIKLFITTIIKKNKKTMIYLKTNIFHNYYILLSYEIYFLN
jgi:hypothetical protein